MRILTHIAVAYLVMLFVTALWRLLPFEVMALAMDSLRGPPDPARALFPDVVLGSSGAQP